VLELSRPLGGWEDLDEVERAMVRSAAGLMLRLEAAQEAQARGEYVSPHLLIRLNSEARRTLTVVRRGRRAPECRNTPDPLDEIKAALAEEAPP
jgi:hypothetical protein